MSSAGQRILTLPNGENVIGVGFHPPDDFYVSEDLVSGTLFLQVLLWNFLLYLTVYHIILIVCGSWVKPDESGIQSMTTLNTANVRRLEDSEDGYHYLFQTLVCLILTSISIIGMIVGQSLFALVFLLAVPFSCITSINSLLDSDFRDIKKFFGDDLVDTIATCLLVMTEAAASIVTLMYVYQVIMTRYAFVVAVFWPPRFYF